MITQVSMAVVFVVGLVGMCGGGSCDAETAPPDGGESSEDGLMATKGEPCQRDPDCSGYLRCRSGTCRIPPAVDGEATESTPKVRFTTDRGGDDAGKRLAAFHVELATTPSQRQRGLMFRREMADGWGMLFIYPGEAERAFYMKNTYIPLDMIFVDGAGRVINVVEGAEPMTEKLRRSAAPARFVLEVEAGVADQQGIDSGAQMRLENVPSSMRPGR